MTNEIFELAIIGGGPAGAAAAIYAARKRIKTVLLVGEWGGQSSVSGDIQNWVGTPSISGADLAKALKEHTERYAGEWLTIETGAWATSIDPQQNFVDVGVKNKDTYRVKAVLVGSGANRRKLDVAGAAEFEHKGLTYCATCDGPLFADQDVVVIGGGNAAFETSLQLLAYCKSVTLLNRSENFRADEVTVAAAKADPKMKLITNAIPTQIVGDGFVTGIKYNDATSNIETLLNVSGIFVEIGLIPNTEWLGTALEMNPVKQVKVDPRTQRSSHPRVWSAGDCSDVLYHQNNIAAGDAVKALEDIYMFLRKGHTE